MAEDRARAAAASRDATRAPLGKHARPYSVHAEKAARAKATLRALNAAQAKVAARAKAAKAKAQAAAKQAAASGVPLDGGYRITSTFAGHADRMKGDVGAGIDYAVPTGTPVHATHAGTVRAAGRSGTGYGTWVTVDYGRGYRAIFGHLSRTKVKPGAVVRAGALLGWSGSTGKSTGPHLHYELRHDGVSVDPRKVDLKTLSPVSATKGATGSPKAIARTLVGDTAQFSCFDKIITRESAWNPRATNPSSGAYGLPQALPARKMASAGSDWRTNPATQIRWAIDYMEDRYGSPCDAWRFWKSNHWY